MTNDYFNHTTTLTKHTLARSAQVNAIFQSIAAGLDKLPAADPLNQGRVTYVADTGAADAYVVSLAKAPTSYVAGLSIVMKATNANTGASTINVNSLGVKTIKRFDGVDVIANDIRSGALIHLVYDGTNFRIVGANGAESALAKDWATKTGGTVDGSEHSAKSWAQETGASAPTAGSSKEWATETGTVDGGLKGARGYAQDASASASAAANSEANAEGHYETFQGVFYGALASDPATDPNGDPPDEGDWYFNTTIKGARQFDGSIWKDVGAAQLTTFVFTASGGETSLSGDDDNANTLAYTVGFLLTYLNGVLLTPDDEYTADDGSSITNLNALTAGDVVVIEAFSTLNLADVYTKDEIDNYAPEHATDTGTDTYESTTNTAVPANGVKITRDFLSTNSTTTPTLDGKTMRSKGGSALWPGAVSGLHELQYASGTDTYLVLEPNPIDEDDMASDSDAAQPTQQSVVRYQENLHGRFVAGTNQYSTIQAAINAIAATAGSQGAGEVYIPAIANAAYSEQLNIPSGAASFLIRGQGTNTRIEGSGDHTLVINSDDITLEHLWIDQVDASGSFDAVRILAQEARLIGLDIDFAPRYGIYANSGSRGHIVAVDLQAGDVTALLLDTNAWYWAISGLEIVNAPAIGADIRGRHSCGSGIIVRNCGGDGWIITGNYNDFSVVAIENDRGVVINGDNNTVRVTATANVSNGLVVAGDENTIIMQVKGNDTGSTGAADVFCSAASTNNRFFGHRGTLSDLGTGNVFYD